MKAKILPSEFEIRDALNYEYATGDFTWRKSRGSRAQAGDKAGSLAKNGNLDIRLDGVSYKAHRLAWKIFYGKDPADQIDHIDGDKTNNRFANLRVVDNTENQRNAKRPSNNTSGHIGVTWDKANSKWAAQIMVDGKTIRLGRFASKAEAIAARKAAEVLHGFHENHGRD
jgi:hypothetical protein